MDQRMTAHHADPAARLSPSAAPRTGEALPPVRDPVEAMATRRGALPAAPLAMPVQSLDADLRAILPRLIAGLSPRTGA
jgi:hypothetical protein